MTAIPSVTDAAAMVEPDAAAGAPMSATGGVAGPVQAPALSLPKGGGAVRGIGESFSSDPVTGTASITVPVATSPGRSGFGPSLTLSYDSGSGNGPFGLGWDLGLPRIARRTDRGLPRYLDAKESDTFVLSGADDLVPVLELTQAGWQPLRMQRTLYGRIYEVRPYRPRVEGLFARIERWTAVDDAATMFWRSITGSDVTTWYGLDPGSRLVDPDDSSHIFAWLISLTHDDCGNLVEYAYKAEDAASVDLSAAHERRRTSGARIAQRYPRSIRYGHLTPYFPDYAAPQPVPAPADPAFELVFDYGECDDASPVPGTEAQPWPARPDPFSTYRAGFELRTYRRCRRALMFHHFPDEPGVGADCVVRSTEFAYTEAQVDPRDPVYSLLASVTQLGWRRQGPGYAKQAMPALVFGWSTPAIDETVRELDAASLRQLPEGLDGQRWQWADLDGDGLGSLINVQGTTWFRKPNLSPANLVPGIDPPRVLAAFGASEGVGALPSLAALASGGQQLQSLDGDGRLALVDLEGPVPGFAERTDEGVWSRWTPLDPLPVFEPRDPQRRFVDLTGDGLPDLLVTRDDAFVWHANLNGDGFGPAQRVPRAPDDDRGPRLLFADSTETVFLADMTGDGLSDLVRVRNGDVSYWPNLGYGRFGARVAMDNAPRFDTPDLFSARRVRLADLDGSGTADLVYFGRRGTLLCFNLCGNGFAASRVLAAAPPLDSASSAQVIDLLANGTSCLVWSSPWPDRANSPLRWIDLMSGAKPHLLTSIDNQMGRETQIRYAPSTRFLVQDLRAGQPWLTRVPFPVQVVEQVTILDWIGRNRFVTRHAYHDGYFDGVEREFRGFGRVEQWDTAEIGALGGSGAFPATPANEEPASYLPPTRTVTWYHTGAWIDDDTLATRVRAGWFAEPGLNAEQQAALHLPDTRLPLSVYQADGTRLPHDCTPDEAREAARALRGSVLRQEVYALDGTPAAALPYTATENDHTIELLQPMGPNLHAVFHVHARESLQCAYERAAYAVGPRLLADPRVTHTLTLDVDPFGNVRLSARVAYGRRHADATLAVDDQALQARTQATLTRASFTAAVLTDDAWRTPLPAETATYELLKCTPKAALADVTNRFGFDELAALAAEAGDGAHDLPFEDVTGQGATAALPYQRRFERTRTLYLSADLTAPLALGQAAAQGLVAERYRQGLTPGLVATVYGAKLTAAELDAALKTDAGWRDLDGGGNLWKPLGRAFYSPLPAAPDLAFARAHFFLVQVVQDAFANATAVTHDVYDLLVAGTTDPLGNAVAAANDYRVLQPVLVTDANGNRGAAAFDLLGYVAGVALMGKTSESLGDSLAGFVPDLTPAQVDAFADSADVAAAAAPLLAQATTRVVTDPGRFAATRAAHPADPTQWQPAFSATIDRETHVSDLPPGAASRLQVRFSYADGHGREIQRKILAEPVTAGAPPRWIGSGWVILDNKGRPVRQYEPFYSALPALPQRFEFGVAVGVSPITVRDPDGRAVATVLPNQSWQKLVTDPWQAQDWDANDTLLVADPTTDPDVGAWLARLPGADLMPTWYQQRVGGALGAAAKAAAQQAAQHAGTPGRAWFDALGRRCLSLADNGAGGRYTTHSRLDIQGRRLGLVDEAGRLAAATIYDMLGTRLHDASMEAGERWQLVDVLGQALRTWDNRGHAGRIEVDALRRPVARYVLGTDAAQSDPRTLGTERQVGRTVYGEGVANAQALNLRTRVYRQFDGAGMVTSNGPDPESGATVSYDFKGNLLALSRQVLADYSALADWRGAPALDVTVYVSATRYDALNRPVALTTPDASVTMTAFDITGKLQRVQSRLQGAATATDFVTGLTYNARGQRTTLTHGNGATSSFDYDPLTFRIAQRITTRAGFPAGQAVVQQLTYADDPVGNVTHIQDDADLQSVVYFRNRRVDPSNDYVFDPLYRLVQASGREHLGQPGGGLVPGTSSYDDAPRCGLPHPGDGNAMGRYVETYDYDPSGNLVTLKHVGSDPSNPGWSRGYVYAEPSLFEPGKASNRLSRTILNPQGASAFTENYSHDAHGQMTRMPQLQSLQWDYADRLLASRRQAVDGNDAEGALHQGERTWYVVDGQGVRVRKVTERANGTRMKERLYLGAFELYREYDGSGLKVTLERQTLHVSDGPRRMAMVETLTQGEGARQPLARYQYDNHLGSACLELDDRARVISYEEYTPYGSTSYQAQDASVQAAAKRYRYAGIERDEESGLDAHSLRYCAPWLGRWISCDPAGPVDGPNLYRYAHNAPTSLVDPRGTDPLPPDPEGSGPPPDPNRKVKPEDRKSTSEGSQTQMQNSSTGSNGAAVQPEDTKTSEFTLAPFGAGGSSGGSGGFSFLYHYRQVTSPGKEFGLQLGFGDVGTSDSNTGTGVVAGTLHLGSEPSDALKDTSQTLTGWYFVAGNVWGQNPTLTDPLSTASPRQVGGANPMASAMYAISAMRYGVEEANAETPGPHLHLKSEFDVNFSLLAQRYGAINGVAVGGFVQPSVFLNLALNDVPSDNWQTNIEVGGSVNAGLGGVIPDPTSKSPITGPGATGIPWSVTETLGVGFTYTKGLSAYSIEPYVSHESLPNVATQGGTGSFIDGAWMFGVKFGFGRINSSDDKH